MVRATTFSDLPDALLATILVALASPDPGEPSLESQELVASQLLSSACLVCKRWRQAVYGEPALWRAFTLRADLLADVSFARRAQWLAATFNLLRRVRQHVQAFSAFKTDALEYTRAGLAVGGWSLPQFLRLLHPGQLSALTIHCRQIPAATVTAVTRFTQLTALHLGSPNLGSPLPACTPSVLLQLSRLQRLRLHSDEQAGSQTLLSSVGQLTGLTWLEVLTHVFVQAPVQFTLPRLRHLRLRGAKLQPPGLAAFPMLTSYNLDMSTVEPLGNCYASYRAGCLYLDRALARQPVQHAGLSALVPPGCSQLSPPTRLELSCCNLASDSQTLGLLAHAAELLVRGCFSRDGGSAAVAPGLGQQPPVSAAAAIQLGRGMSRAALSCLLQQMPALREAGFEACLAGDPAVLDCTSLTSGLTRLSLRGNDLTAMPDGTYPPALADLDLGGNELTRLPPHVLDCTALTRLALDDNEQLMLSLTDARQLLARLPRLARLELGSASLLAPQVRQALENRPGLQLSFTWGDTESAGMTSGSEEEWGSDED